MPVTIRPAVPADYDAVADLSVLGYGHVSDAYRAVLRDVAGRAQSSDVLVAELDGAIVGAVAYSHKGGALEDIAFGPDEAEFRMLVVDPAARGRGIGRLLSQACLDKAVADRRTAMVISVWDGNTPAHALYSAMGFRHEPSRDWEPEPGVVLQCWLKDLLCDQCGEPGAHGACARRRELEPPRYCPHCGRRMVVQVVPTGWTARCVEHGQRTA